MSEHRIVFLDRDAIRVPLRAPRFAHRWTEFPTTSPSEVRECLQDATIAITNRVFIRDAELSRLPLLKFIAVAATGVDCIDLECCRRRGVVVSNIRDWSVSVPEHVFSLILALRRNLFSYHEAVRAGKWSASPTYTMLLEPMPQALKGSTMGIIGYGAVGRSVARIAEGFGMNVVVAERRGAAEIRPDRVRFDRVLESSDILVVLCPLTPETAGLIGEAELSRMRPGALLINCARGGIVDDAALADALEQGRIAGAGVDVLSKEPPPADHPLLRPDLPNLVVTPHVAWASVQSLESLAEQLIGNLEAFAAGDPRNVVT